MKTQERQISFEEARQRVERLRREIEHHNYLYYVESNPEVSDAEYDELMEKLKRLESTYPELITPDSPTQRVSGSVARGFKHIKHRIPMMSIDNVSTESEALEFDKRVKRFLKITENERKYHISEQNDPVSSLGETSVEKGKKELGPLTHHVFSKAIGYTAEPKFDGVSVSITYENGMFVQCATRGDGRIGEDISANFRTIKAIPLRLNTHDGVPKIIEVRGEVLIPIEAFKRLNKELAESGEPLFANPRNAASGSLRQLDTSITAKRPLDFYAWGVGEVVGYEFDTEWKIIRTLRDWGFKIETRIMHCRDINEAISYYREMESTRDDLPYEADGVVIKVDRLDYQRELGATAKHPRWSIAYKFKPRQATTKIREIVIQVGRIGLLTPVANLDPVRIGGVTVRRATLHTEDIIMEKDIRVGDTVVVERAGDVIPEIVKPIVEKRTGEEKIFRMPNVCPSCGTKVEKTFRDPGRTEGGYYYCPNASCPVQLRGRIKHLASRKAFNIEGLGEKIVEQFMKEGLIRDLADVFYLKKKDFIELERFAEKSASNLEEEIEKGKRISFDRFLYALSIRHVGERLSQILAENFPNLKTLMEAEEERLMEISTVGPEVAKSIVNFFTEKKNRNIIEKMLDAGVRIEYKFKKVGVIYELPLQGKTFVFTGTLESFTREEAKRIVEELGGRVSTSVTKKTDYVVAGKDTGSKLDTAKSLGIKIIDEKEFKKLVKT
jgi:DNA ligase (NAD+)